MATAQGDAGLRRLLTSQGSELVNAVVAVLDDLGFVVHDVDSEIATEANTVKVEDLRVTDSVEPAWTNITEVRGYTGGAKTSDLQRIGRFVALRLERGGTRPTSCWYIVNQFIGMDPDSRSAPLSGAPDDVSVFAHDGGLVLDTRELFGLMTDVEAGRVTRTEARAALRTASGVFSSISSEPKQ